MMIRLEARDFLTDALYLYHIRCSICKPYDIAAQSKMLRIRSFFACASPCHVRIPYKLLSNSYGVQGTYFLSRKHDLASL